MTQKLIIDADPGIGDALAVLTAMVDPSIDLLAVTAVGGTISGLQSTRNLQFLVELADPVRHPRIGQSEAPAHVAGNECVTRHSFNFNGPNGLGSCPVAVPDLHNRRESIKLIADIVREFPGEVRILALGPLTNVAAACECDPQLCDLISDLVILGGATTVGDVSPVAEFNIHADPEAAHAILHSSLYRTLIPLEVSSQPMLTFEDVDVLSGLIESSDVGQVVSEMFHHAIRAQRQHLASEGFSLHAVTALAVACRAEKYTTESVSADVETTGELTRGMTVIDRRPVRSRTTNTDVVTHVDSAGIVDYFARSIRRASK